MIFQIVLAVFLFSSYGNYGVSGESFLIFIHEYYPEIPGTCFYAMCEKSTHNTTYDCAKKYTKNGKVKAAFCRLQQKENSTNEFYRTSAEGIRENSILYIYGDAFIYHKTDASGKLVEIICGTYSSKATKETQKTMDEKCKFEGFELKKVDNTNC